MGKAMQQMELFPFWPFIPPFYEIITGIVLGGQVTAA
jgi:hypothetical protein